MQILKSPEDIETRGLARLGKFKWWFTVLLIIGIFVLIYILVFLGRESMKMINSESLFLITNVYAEVGPTTTAKPKENIGESFNPRTFVMLGVYILLAVIYIIAVCVLLRSNNADKVDKAGDLAKTLTGFFIGTATNLFT